MYCIDNPLLPSDMLHHGLPSPMEDKEVAEAASSLSALPEDSPPSDSTPGDGEQAGEQEEVGEDEEAAARPATPPMVQMILDMGFTRAQVNVAMQRLVSGIDTALKMYHNIAPTFHEAYFL